MALFFVGLSKDDIKHVFSLKKCIQILDVFTFSV